MDEKGHFVAPTPHQSLLAKLCPSLLARAYTYFASYHYNRFRRKGDKTDLERGIEYDWKALALRTIGHHSHRYSSLLNLAIVIRARFYQWNVVEDDLREVILLNREALALCPKGHPSHVKALNGLSHSLFMSYRSDRTMRDLEEVIRYVRDALARSPIKSSRRVSSSLVGQPRRFTLLALLENPSTVRL